MNNEQEQRTWVKEEIAVLLQKLTSAYLFNLIFVWGTLLSLSTDVLESSLWTNREISFCLFKLFRIFGKKSGMRGNENFLHFQIFLKTELGLKILYNFIDSIESSQEFGVMTSTLRWIAGLNEGSHNFVDFSISS